MKESLTRAGTSVRSVMSNSTDPGTAAALSNAATELKTASDAVIDLNETTRNTPYAFVGLRLESVRLADVVPAGEETSQAIAAQGTARLEHSRTAGNHISRALASLAKLEEKYQQVKRDLKRADDILAFKKMHRIFIENSMTMLNPPNLIRLKEVMKLRRDMMAEFARILADDPQLLRRYMNKMNERTWSIRDQLTFVARDQEELSQRVIEWSGVAQQPPKLAKYQVDALENHLVELEGVFNRLADLQNEFVSWLPLVEGAQKGNVADAVTKFKAAGNGPDTSKKLDPILSKVTKVEDKLTAVAQSLRQLNRDSTDPEIVNNAARRFPKLQNLQRDVQLWAGKLELHQDGLVHESYSVDQENRRNQLLEYTVKIASLENLLLGALRTEDSQLPQQPNCWRLKLC